MKEKFKVIEAFTKTVIIDKDIVEKIRENEYVEPSEINRNSVSISEAKITEKEDCWSNFVKNIEDEKEDSREILYWDAEYDTEFGIHAANTF